jgi:hypothetical protein
MFYYVAGYYLAMKAAFLFGLVRIQVKFETMKDHWLFLGVLYTLGVAFLSFVFLTSWQEFPWPAWQRRVAAVIGLSPWQSWLAQTFVLSTLYFWLMAKFDEGVIFWTLLLLGILLVWF